MSHRRGWTVAALLAAWALIGPRVPAQDSGFPGRASSRSNPSHIPLQLPDAPTDASGAESLLDSRLRNVPAIQDQQVQQLLRDMLKDPTKLSKDLSKPFATLRDQLSPTKGVDQESLKAIQAILAGLEKQTGQKLDVNDGFLQDMVKRYAAKAGPEGEPRRGSPRRGPPSGTRPRARERSTPPSHAPVDSAPPPAARDGQQTTALAKQLAELAERIKPGPALTNSPAWKRMTESLSRYKLANDPAFGLSSADSLLGRWGLDTSLGKLFSPERWSFRPQLPTPALPNVTNWLPSLGQGGGRWGAGAPGLPAAPAGGVWRGLLWIVVLLIVGGAVWLALTWRRLARVEAAERASEDFGPWPVSPGRVSTPAELIRAFEYLSLLVLGGAARNWNHRHIAAALADAGAGAERRRAAFALAAAYEHARYAPAGHALSADELGAARQHLCVLAGAPTV